MSVLGALMMQNAVIPAVRSILQPTDFYRYAHAAIYTVELAIHEQGVPVDLLTVADVLAETQQLDQVGGKGTLVQIAAYPTAASNAPHHARIIHEHAVLRALIAAGQQIVQLGYDRGANTQELVRQARQLLQGIAA